MLMAGLMAVSAAQAQDHGHLNVGAQTWTQGSRLVWENGAIFQQTARYVKTLNFGTNVRYAGFYEGNITLTALHSRDAFGELVPGSSAPGSFILGEIVSVAGPEGGAFGFWEPSAPNGTPTFSIPVGTTDARVRFEVSDAALGAGAEGADPYGHIHGRRFTATRPGIYTVGFRAHDISVNGANAGPIHTSSELILIDFQAGYNIKEVRLVENRPQITVGTRVGFVFTIESSDDLNDPNDWEPVATLTGDDTFQTAIDEMPLTSAKFYRVGVTSAI